MWFSLKHIFFYVPHECKVTREPDISSHSPIHDCACSYGSASKPCYHGNVCHAANVSIRNVRGQLIYSQLSPYSDCCWFHRGILVPYPAGARSLSPTPPDRLRDPPSLLSSGYRRFSPPHWIKWLGLGSDHRVQACLNACLNSSIHFYGAVFNLEQGRLCVVLFCSLNVMISLLSL